MAAADAFDHPAIPGGDREPASGSGYLLPGGCISAPSRRLYLRTLLDAALWMGAAPLGVRLLARLGSRALLRTGLRGWARGVRRALRIRLEVEGVEDLDPGERYVVVPLHEGLADAVAMLHLPLRMRFALRDELLGWRVLGPALRAADPIPICPERGVWSYRRLLRGARRAVERGESVVVFAQGTILGIETELQEGAFRLARALERPILPIALTGSHRVWEHAFSPRLRRGERVSLRVLAPVPAAEVRCTPAAELRRAVQARLKASALDGRMAPPRRFVPRRDGYWIGYRFGIDPAFPALAAEVAQARAAASPR
jgi:1-acyl-sn-glycerol-3-phosphate acyltransferase